MLHEYLKKKRQQLNLATKDLSARTALDPSLISRFEKGERIPTATQLKKLAEALQLDFPQLQLMSYSLQVNKVLKDCPEELREEVLQGLLAGKVKTQIASQEVDALLKDLQQVMLLNQQEQRRHAHWPLAYQQAWTSCYQQILSLQGIQFSRSELSQILMEGKTIADRTIQDHLKALQLKEWLSLFESDPVKALEGSYEGLAKQKLTKQTRELIQEIQFSLGESQDHRFLVDIYLLLEEGLNELEKSAKWSVELMWNAFTVSLTRMVPCEELAPLDWRTEKQLAFYLSKIARNTRKMIDSLD